MDVLKQQTLQQALEMAGLQELPQKWDGQSDFKECIVMINTLVGEAYFMGLKDDTHKSGYKVSKSFVSTARYRRTKDDVIYPLKSGKTEQQRAATPLIVQPENSTDLRVRFPNHESALEAIKKIGKVRNLTPMHNYEVAIAYLERNRELIDNN